MHAYTTDLGIRPRHAIQCIEVLTRPRNTSPTQPTGLSSSLARRSFQPAHHCTDIDIINNVAINLSLTDLYCSHFTITFRMIRLTCQGHGPLKI